MVKILIKLPIDIKYSILSKLQIQDLRNASLACKDFNSLIKNKISITPIFKKNLVNMLLNNHGRDIYFSYKSYLQNSEKDSNDPYLEITKIQRKCINDLLSKLIPDQKQIISSYSTLEVLDLDLVSEILCPSFNLLFTELGALTYQLQEKSRKQAFKEYLLRLDNYELKDIINHYREQMKVDKENQRIQSIKEYQQEIRYELEEESYYFNDSHSYYHEIEDKLLCNTQRKPKKCSKPRKNTNSRLK